MERFFRRRVARRREVLTNEAGGAYVQWTLGGVLGTQEVTATVTDLGDFLFSATAR